MASPQVSTIYTITGNNSQCVKSITFAINVLSRPILNISTSKQKICIGDNTTIFATGCQSYSWHPSGYPIPTNTTMAIITPTASTNFTITGYNGTDSSSCPFTKEILIEVVPQITATAVWTVGVCQGETVKIHAEGSNTYRWMPWEGLSNPSIAQPYASPKVTTIYTVHVSDNGFCGTTTTVMVRVYPQPTVNAGVDMNVNSDEVINLNATGSGTLTWVFGDNIICHVCPNSQITPTRSGVYQVQSTNQYGCKATDDVWVELTDDYPIYIPNSFTPNYDGLNDVFYVYGQSIIKFELNIYNRWNQKIYSSNDQLQGWDGVYKGEIVKNDTYMYILNYTTANGRKHTKNGYITVLKEDY
ncbi:MAG: gliding motility-associated C-terminal domain-containing protein [Sphingobacteriaceae bacterium]